MILSLATTLRTVFTVYAAFWAFVLIGLFFGVGLLMRRAERHGDHPK